MGAYQPRPCRQPTALIAAELMGNLPESVDVCTTNMHFLIPGMIIALEVKVVEDVALKAFGVVI